MQFVDPERGRRLLIFESTAKAMEAIDGMHADEPLAIMPIADRNEFDVLLAAHKRSDSTTLAYNLRFDAGNAVARYVNVRELRAAIAFYLAME